MTRILAILLFALPALAQTSNHWVTLEWDANTEPDLAGYRIYQRTETNSPFTVTAVVTNGTTVTLSNLVKGVSYHWAATAFDTEGLESDFSNEVEHGWPKPPVMRIHPTLWGSISLDGPWEILQAWTNEYSMDVITNSTKFLKGLLVIDTDE